LGWMRVDATPPSHSLFRMGRLRQLFDSMDFFWGRWVVGYDLGRQIELARRLGHQLGGGESDDADHRPSKFPWLKTLVAAGIVAGTWALVIRLRRRRVGVPGRSGAAARVAGTPVARLYDRALRMLARRGMARRLSETPREYAARVTASGVAGGDVLARLTELYVGARFGRRQVDDHTLRELGHGLTDLGRVQPSVPAARA